jgi:hypothetical protein
LLGFSNPGSFISTTTWVMTVATSICLPWSAMAFLKGYQVAYGTLGLGHQHVQSLRRYLISGGLNPEENHAHLRSIAVHEHYACFLRHDLHQRNGKGFSLGVLLIGIDRIGKAGVSSEGKNYRPGQLSFTIYLTKRFLSSMNFTILNIMLL